MMFAFVALAFYIGIFFGKYLSANKSLPQPILKNASVPLKQLISEFRDFILAIECGTLSTEADEAIKMLEDFAQQKALPKLKLRPLLEGEILKKYKDDFSTGQTSAERGNIIKRWHKKGWRFPDELRLSLLRGGTPEAWRADLRNMFDEQDRSL